MKYSGKYDLTYATEGSAGVDLRAYLGGGDVFSLTLLPGCSFKLHTSVSVEFSPGTYGIVLPRSSKGSEGLVLANTAGVIDNDYRGEIILNVRNTGKKPIVIKDEERIAQLIVMPYVKETLERVDSVSIDTDRGVGGFGSTGDK